MPFTVRFPLSTKSAPLIVPVNVGDALGAKLATTNAVEAALKDLELLKGVKVNYSKPTS